MPALPAARKISRAYLAVLLILFCTLPCLAQNFDKERVLLPEGVRKRVGFAPFLSSAPLPELGLGPESTTISRMYPAREGKSSFLGLCTDSRTLDDRLSDNLDQIDNILGCLVVSHAVLAGLDFFYFSKDITTFRISFFRNSVDVFRFRGSRRKAYLYFTF